MDAQGNPPAVTAQIEHRIFHGSAGATGDMMDTDKKQAFYLVLSESFIKNNWDQLLLDRDFPRKEVGSADEWVMLAKRGEIKALGATVLIQNKLPRS